VDEDVRARLDELEVRLHAVELAFRSMLVRDLPGSTMDLEGGLGGTGGKGLGPGGGGGGGAMAPGGGGGFVSVENVLLTQVPEAILSWLAAENEPLAFEFPQEGSETDRAAWWAKLASHLETSAKAIPAAVAAAWINQHLGFG
jgi:hypothetical protein